MTAQLALINRHHVWLFPIKHTAVQIQNLFAQTDSSQENAPSIYLSFRTRFCASVINDRVCMTSYS